MYFKQEYKLDPLVEDLFAVLEKHCGPTNGMKRVSIDYDNMHDALRAALIIYATLSGGNRQSQLGCSGRLGINRNTLRKNLRHNKYLEPLTYALFPATKQDLYALKCKMGLNRNG
jgi:DNA-binding protein Fis